LTHSLNHVEISASLQDKIVWDVLIGISCCSCTCWAVWGFFF